MVAIGCHAQSPKCEIAGAITLDGKPLSNGEVVFEALDNTSSEAGKIEGGRYRIKANAGKYKVSVNASEKRPNPNPPEMRGDPWLFVSIIPARYNEDSTLTAQVTAVGDNVVDFTLTSD